MPVDVTSDETKAREALKLLSRYAPCAHENHSPLGAGSVWAKCEDCGARVELARAEQARVAADAFDDAVEMIGRFLTAHAAALAAASRVGAEEGIEKAARHIETRKGRVRLGGRMVASLHSGVAKVLAAEIRALASGALTRAGR